MPKSPILTNSPVFTGPFAEPVYIVTYTSAMEHHFDVPVDREYLDQILVDREYLDQMLHKKKKKKNKRRPKCDCVNCQKENCEECLNCTNKKRKQKCMKRQCLHKP
jgi:hypothetical protein